MEAMLNRFAWVLLIIAALMILTMIYHIGNRPDPVPPSIRGITPDERRQISNLEKRFGLRGMTWVIERESGTINYYRNGAWRTIELKPSSPELPR